MSVACESARGVEKQEKTGNVEAAPADSEKRSNLGGEKKKRTVRGRGAELRKRTVNLAKTPKSWRKTKGVEQRHSHKEKRTKQD